MVLCSSFIFQLGGLYVSHLSPTFVRLIHSLFSYLLPSQPSRGKQKTGICRRTTSPRWEQTICWDDLTIEDVADRSLELAIWDHDRLGHQDFLGGARFNLGTGNEQYSHAVMSCDGKILSRFGHLRHCLGQSATLSQSPIIHHVYGSFGHIT